MPIIQCPAQHKKLSEGYSIAVSYCTYCKNGGVFNYYSPLLADMLIKSVKVTHLAEKAQVQVLVSFYTGSSDVAEYTHIFNDESFNEKPLDFVRFQAVKRWLTKNDSPTVTAYVATIIAKFVANNSDPAVDLWTNHPAYTVAKSFVFPSSGPEVSPDSIVGSLKAVVPGLSSYTRCPDCVSKFRVQVAAGEFPQPPEEKPLDYIIVHLNDDHRWTRVQIADWLDTLDLDLKVGEPKPVEQKPCDCALCQAGYKTGDPVESLMKLMYTKKYESIAEAGKKFNEYIEAAQKNNKTTTFKKTADPKAIQPAWSKFTQPNWKKGGGK